MKTGPFKFGNLLVHVRLMTSGLDQPWIGSWCITHESDPEEVISSGSVDQQSTYEAAHEAARVAGIAHATSIDH